MGPALLLKTHETIDGAKSVLVPPGTPRGQKLKLRESGLPIDIGNYKRGDTIVEVDISVPKNISKDEKDILLKLRALRDKGGKKFF